MNVAQFPVKDPFGNDSTKYMLMDNNGMPVVSAAKFFKWLDNTGKASNTIKTYAHHLKLYFEFLEERNESYENPSIVLLGEFVAWLRNPTPARNILNMNSELTKEKRSPSTINAIITVVSGFYEFLIRLEDFGSGITDAMTRQVSGRFRTFKPFLHHISKGKKVDKNILKQKVPRRPVKTLSVRDIQQIDEACSNIRDKLLIRILLDAGLRIDEALELWIENFDISKNMITVRKSKTSAGTGRRVYVSSETMNLFQDYLYYIHDAEGFDTNYVFVNLRGPNKGEKWNYRAAYAFVKRVRKKTGVDFTPHMFRHTWATENHSNGMSVAVLKELGGWANVQTPLQIYVNPTDEDIREEYDTTQEIKRRKDERRLAKRAARTT